MLYYTATLVSVDGQQSGCPAGLMIMEAWLPLLGLNGVLKRGGTRNSRWKPLSPMTMTNQLRRWTVLMLAGLGLLALALVVWMRFVFGDPSPPLTPELFRAARKQWQAAAPPDYDIEIQVTGTQSARYRAQVRGGETIAAFRNDQPLTQRRTFGTWSVPGMFSTISRDVEALEKVAAGKADVDTPRLNLRATFDPQHGFPARYRRIQYGSEVEVQWEVTRFEVVKHGSAPAGDGE